MIVSLGFVAAFLLLLASSFFSAAETALVSLSAPKAKRLALRNPHLAHMLSGWLEQPHELLTTILIGNTLSNVMFAGIVTTLAVRIFYSFDKTVIEFATWGIETACVVIIAEMAPKFFARANPERTSLIVLPVLGRTRRLFRPLFSLISAPLGLLFPKWKPIAGGTLMTFSLEELKGFFEEGTANTSVPAESVGMMQRVLAINARTARDIMTPLERVDVVELDPPGRSPRDRDRVIDLIIENGHTRTPIKMKGEIIGFIHSDDLLPLIINDTGADIVSLLRKAMDVPADRRVNDLLQDFRNSGVHAGFVYDSTRRFVGLVTLEDVLEEITGEILDEYDVANPYTVLSG